MVDDTTAPEIHKRTPALRRSDRVALVIPIRVRGTDSQGQPFDEKSQTLVISRHGALIAFARPLAEGQDITIHCIGTGREALARVIEQAEEEKRPSLYGVEIITPEVNIWEVHFPPVTDSEMAAGRLLLECSRCHATELAYLNLGEIEIFQKNKCVSRICESCNSVTVWAQAELRKLQVEIATITVDPMSGEAEPAAAQHTEDERNDPRIALTIDGCIRTTQYGEDIVQTENVSESGARFASRRLYAMGASVGVAIPYVRTGANVFVQATISWSRSSETGGITNYGLVYSHAARRARRYRPRTKITIGFIGSGFRSTGRVVDISMKGALVECTEEFKPGDAVRMGIEMGTETIRIAATAKRTIPNLGTGFEFTQMGRNDRTLLRRLIMQIEKQR
ncbi:MAG: PilZ domain-containing protein [Terriglobia bacterium]